MQASRECVMPSEPIAILNQANKGIEQVRFVGLTQVINVRRARWSRALFSLLVILILCIAVLSSIQRTDAVLVLWINRVTMQ